MKHECFENMEPESYPMIEQVQLDVYNSIELFEDVEMLQNWLLYWTGSFLHGVYHNFKDVKKYNSIYFCLLQSQSYQLEWIKFSMFSGQYDLTMRELRTILENALYHFKYDYSLEYHNMSVQEKYHKMVSDAENDPRVTYGKSVFQKSGYKKWNKVYSEIFKKLSSYVHTTIGRNNALKIDSEGFNALLNVSFDVQRMKECIDMFYKVILVEVELMEIILCDVYGVDKMSLGYKKVFER